MIKLLLCPLLICFFTFQGFSQKNNIWKDYPNLGIMQYLVILDENLKEPNIYQNLEFKPSKLITSKNTILNSLKIRYNVKKDVMECEIGAHHSIIRSPEKLKEVNINGEYFEYKKYLVEDNPTCGYLQRLYAGGQKIYAKHFFSPIKTDAEENQLESYYLIQDKGKLPTKLTSINKLLSHFFKGFINQARKFEKNNELNLNSPKDLQKLLIYLDHLSKDRVASR